MTQQHRESQKESTERLDKIFTVLMELKVSTAKLEGALSSIPDHEKRLRSLEDRVRSHDPDGLDDLEEHLEKLDIRLVALEKVDFGRQAVAKRSHTILAISLSIFTLLATVVKEVVLAIMSRT